MSHDPEALAHLAQYGVWPKHIMEAERRARQARDLAEREDFHDRMSRAGETPSLSSTPEPIERVVSDPSDKARIAELEEKLRRVSAALDAATKPPPEPELFDDDGIPEAFRSLMLPGESPERFTERMRRRLQALRHLQMDGTKPTPSRALPDMTPEESEELADLERRNSQHKWLD